MYHIYISLCLWIYLSFWEETPFPFFPNIHIKFVLKQSANFIYGCRKVAENLPPRLFASTPGRRWEREGDQFMKCKSLFLGSLLSRWVKCGMLWQWLHECRNERTGTCGIYIYIWIQIVYEHAACMSGQMQAFEVKNSWKLGLQLVVGQATSWQLLLSMGNGKQPSFWMDQFPTFSWSFFPAYTDGLNKCRCIVAVIFVSFGNKACLLVHLSTQPSPISMAINDLVVVYFAVQVPETNLLRPDKQFLW